MVATDAQLPVFFPAMVIVTFTMTSRTDRRAGMLVAGPVAVGMYFVDAFVSTGSAWSPQSLGLVAWIGMTAAAGDAVRSRRAYVAEVEERARRAEQTREEEAGRRVIQERVRIARELHDVVAHHIAVINVQAGAASHVLTRHPEQADQALTHIRAACDTVLSELASIVGVLRQSDDDVAVEPVRGLARLTDMLDALAAAGLTVERKQVGAARELPAVVDLAAYRILQEALTNAHKYGTGTAHLTVTYTVDAVTLDVVNTVAEDRIPSRSGYGILGMRERAATAGGTLDTQASRRPVRRARRPTRPSTESRAMTIRVLLADDQALIRAGYKMILDAEPDLEVVGEAVNGRDAVFLARTTRADVVLMDLRMPEVDGIEATRRIAADDDLAGVRILVLTTFENDENVLHAVRAGASGFLGKNVGPDELIHAIRIVAAGDALLSPKATRGLVQHVLDQPEPVRATALDQLTDREREVVVLVAHGLSNDDIADRLSLSPLTAKTHVNRAMTKLGARDRAQLVVIAYQNGLVRPGDALP